MHTPNSKHSSIKAKTYGVLGDHLKKRPANQLLKKCFFDGVETLKVFFYIHSTSTTENTRCYKMFELQGNENIYKKMIWRRYIKNQHLTKRKKFNWKLRLSIVRNGQPRSLHPFLFSHGYDSLSPLPPIGHLPMAPASNLPSTLPSNLWIIHIGVTFTHKILMFFATLNPKWPCSFV